MLEGEIDKPAFQTRVRKSTWVRASLGGLLRFHVSPGAIVEGGQPLATSESVFGEARSVIIAPQDGIVLGMATHPAVHPGEPVCHVAIPTKSIQTIRAAIESALAQTAARAGARRSRDQRHCLESAGRGVTGRPWLTRSRLDFFQK